MLWTDEKTSLLTTIVDMMHTIILWTFKSTHQFIFSDDIGAFCFSFRVFLTDTFMILRMDQLNNILYSHVGKQCRIFILHSYNRNKLSGYMLDMNTYII